MRKYIAAILIAGTLVGCQDFLEEKVVTTLTQDYYKSPEGLEILTKGSYRILRYKSDYNQGHYLFGTCSDVEVFTWSNADRVAMGGYTPDAWNYDVTGTRMAPNLTNLIGEVIPNKGSEGAYPTINSCNLFLENYENLSAADKEKLKARKGEILFLRTYAYYLVSNQLGAVPIVTKSVSGMPANFYFPKAPLEDLYKMLISDMKDAVDNYLPETTGDLGRITKPAGAHFLAKLYLNRAQAAEFQNSSEPTLKALYKGTDAEDLNNSIHYATVAIGLVKPKTTSDGLTPDFGTLWLNAKGTDSYTRDKLPEILLAAQYESSQSYDGRYGNCLVHLYNSNHTDFRAWTARTMEYGRPYATASASDWGYDMYTDRANDSRYYKTYLTDYVTTATSGSNAPWNVLSAFIYNNFIKKSSDKSAVSGVGKMQQLGQRSIVYIENSKDEPLDSLWVASQPFIMNVRWTVGRPSGGYADVSNGNVVLKPGVEDMLKNPVIKDKGTRKIYYRLDGDKGELYGLDRGFTPATHYMGPAKWLDINRGNGTNANGNGAIDVVLMRLAETYLIRAEAYGRKGEYANAINDLNVIRKRAAYHPGETRKDVLVNLEPSVLTGKLAIPTDEKVSPYKVISDSYEKIKITGKEWTPGTDEFKKENYPEGVSDYFVQFIYNERARELIFELTNWEDLHNAGILYERVVAHDMMGAPSSSTGTEYFPFPIDDIGGNLGALGKGKGQFERKFTFKPWPKAYLDLLTDQNGVTLDEAAKKAYQNYGY